MEETGMTREEMLADLKGQNALRSAPGLANITNQPVTGIAQIPVKPSVTLAELPVIEEKENPVALVTSSKPASSELDGAPASIRKMALTAPHREHMEQTFDQLQGRLHAIKRDSRRPSISGATIAINPASSGPASALNDLPAAAAAAAAAPMGGLAAKLESLKRESVRPSFSNSGQQQVQFEAAGQYDMHALSRLAQQLFADPEFSALCEKGMNAQLTRSKDGATEETKIKELAGMVKTLRRGMKEIQQRTQLLIDQSVRYEKEASQQIESVKLSSESAAMAAQAELAKARCEAATAAANHKTGFLQSI